MPWSWGELHDLKFDGESLLRLRSYISDKIMIMKQTIITLMKLLIVIKKTTTCTSIQVLADAQQSK